MTEKAIEKKELIDICSQMLLDCQVFAPVDADGIKLYKEITDPEKITWSEGNSHRPVKELFFPLTERLFSFHQTKSGIKLEQLGNHNRKRVIIGARPCDCFGLTILDNVFQWGDYEDALYLTLRHNTTIISLSCLKPESFCFCTATNLSPFEEKGSDIMLTDIGGNTFLAKIITEKGKTLFEKFNHYLHDATAEQLGKRAKLVQEVISKMPGPLPLDEIESWLGKNFENPVWEKIALGCIGCGTCAYLCPTCHCFDLVDESKGYGGERRRNWDSCAFDHFTQMAGHQPRPLQWQRFRQRIMHKFKYFKDRFSQIACVGCGRCRALCSSHKDILEIIRTFKDTPDISKSGTEISGKGLTK